MRSGNSDPTGGLLLGAGFGLLLFYRGFKRFREYKVIADTPRIPIRSMPMGLVHIRGTAQSQELVQSPLTRTPCCFYKVVVERWKTEDRSGHWEEHFVDRDGLKFYVQDATGRVLIDSYSAEYDLPENATRTVNGSQGAAGVSTASAATQPSDLEVLQYVDQAGSRRFLQWAEHKMQQKGPLQDPKQEHARQHLLDMVQAGIAIQHSGKLPVDLIQRTIESRGPLDDPQQELGRQALLAHIRTTGTLPFEMPKPSAAQGRYRLHEYLILPGREYSVTGTCAENTAQQDAQDRIVIEQGRNEKTFVVSGREEQAAQKDMRWSSLKMVLGGAALTLGCLAGLLLHFKMF